MIALENSTKINIPTNWYSLIPLAILSVGSIWLGYTLITNIDKFNASASIKPILFFFGAIFLCIPIIALLGASYELSKKMEISKSGFSISWLGGKKMNVPWKDVAGVYFYKFYYTSKYNPVTGTYNHVLKILPNPGTEFYKHNSKGVSILAEERFESEDMKELVKAVEAIEAVGIKVNKKSPDQ